MRKRKTDKHYIVLAVVSIVITLVGIIYSFNNRGYWAVGGEIFIVPLIVLMRFLYKDMKTKLEWN